YQNFISSITAISMITTFLNRQQLASNCNTKVGRLTGSGQQSIKYYTASITLFFLDLFLFFLSFQISTPFLGSFILLSVTITSLNFIAGPSSFPNVSFLHSRSRAFFTNLFLSFRFFFGSRHVL